MARKTGLQCSAAKRAKPTTSAAWATRRPSMANSNAAPSSPEIYAKMTSVAARTWRRPPLIHNRALRWTSAAAALIYLALALASLDVNWLRVYQGLERGWRLVHGFLIPNFTRRWSDILTG